MQLQVRSWRAEASRRRPMVAGGGGFESGGMASGLPNEHAVLVDHGRCWHVLHVSK